jgi:hypothetical protein
VQWPKQLDALVEAARRLGLVSDEHRVAAPVGLRTGHACAALGFLAT